MPHPCNAIPRTSLALLLLATLAITATILPARTNAQDPETVVLASMLVPRAVGMGLTGQESGPAVSFARALRPDPYLKENGFILDQCRTTQYQPDLLQGGLSFSDSLGRSIHLSSRIGYEAQAPDRFRVTSLRTTPITPAIPAYEVYILPAERMSLEAMSGMPLASLLAFARENTIRILPDSLDLSPQTYNVLVFALDRLQPGDEWLVFADQRSGFTWNREGWALAGVTARFAVNGPQEHVFRVFYAPGPENALSGRVVAVGAFTNRYMPAAPSDAVPALVNMPGAASLLNRYEAKAFPTLH